MTDLIERIETTRFLGGEFLLWLWYHQENELDVPGADGISVVLQSPLRLAEVLSPTENVTVNGRLGCASPEAYQALLQGKLPSKVALHLEHDDQVFGATFDGLRWALSGLKVPEPEEGGPEERLLWRMENLERVQGWLDALYSGFLKRRLAPDWQETELPRLRSWVMALPATSPQVDDGGMRE